VPKDQFDAYMKRWLEQLPSAFAAPAAQPAAAG
jgi:hypothetical protein